MRTVYHDTFLINEGLVYNKITSIVSTYVYIGMYSTTLDYHIYITRLFSDYMTMRSMSVPYRYSIFCLLYLAATNCFLQKILI